MAYKGGLILLCLLLAACTAAGPPADCDPSVGPCIKTHQGQSVTLEIKPRPLAAMRELEFIVMAPFTDTRELKIELAMPGMVMGQNNITLARAAHGLYSGRGVIVRCPSGNTLWLAKVTDGETLLAEYRFDVRR